jgi:formylglycine-generating enzyme required for sulfatase activity
VPDRPATARSTSTPTPEPTPTPKLLTFALEVVTVDVTGQNISRKRGNATYFSEDLGNGIALDMVKIPGGTFQMGAVKGEEGASSDEFPQHPVTVKEFWMGKFVVTQEQWKTIVLLPKIKTVLKESPSRFKGKDLPIEQVSWHEAKEFCDRLSKKTGKTFDLPTEAQWEYACRAGTTTPFHFGETITTDVANFEGNYTYGKASKGTYREKTIAVDSFAPNAFGLYNMHGNVWEWCLDPWHPNYGDAPSDDRVWDASNDSGSELRLMRGGSWRLNPGGCRSALRSNYVPASQYFNVGFRVVCLSSRGLS